MRLTTRTQLAMRTLMFCALNPDRIIPTSEVAEKCKASGNHLGQVVNLLGRNNLLDTHRGRGGGLRLSKSAEDISIGQVMRALEETSSFAECFKSDGGQCPLSPHCRLRGKLSSALEAFYASLDNVSLAELTVGNSGMSGLFGVEPV